MKMKSDTKRMGEIRPKPSEEETNLKKGKPY